MPTGFFSWLDSPAWKNHQSVNYTPPGNSWHHETTMSERNDNPERPEADGAKEPLAGRSFVSIVITQFLGAFNDNAFKQLILLLAVGLSMEAGDSYHQSLAGGVFALPFVLFSGFAGSFADRYSKTFIFRFCKAWEVLVMLLGCFAFYMGNIPLLYFTLFMMGMQSAFFGPAKYGIIPELFPSGRLSKANGIILMTTYLAITLGTATAGIIKDYFGSGGSGNAGGDLALGELYLAQGALVLLAVLGTLSALGVRRAPVADPGVQLRGKIFGELGTTLKSIFSNRLFSSVALTYAYFWGLGAALLMLCNAYGKILMALDDSSTSMLLVFLSVGIALGAFGGSLVSKGKVDFRIYRTGLGLLLLSLLLLGWTHQDLQLSGWTLDRIHAARATLFLLGFAGGMFALPLQTSIQLWSPGDLRGRVMAGVNFLCFLSIFLFSGVFWAARELAGSDGIQWIGAGLGGLTVLVHLLARRGLARAEEELN